MTKEVQIEELEAAELKIQQAVSELLELVARAKRWRAERASKESLKEQTFRTGGESVIK